MRNDKQEIYKLLMDGYFGIGGFFDGSYLRPHPRESGEKYNLRKRLAYYLNYLKPCVDAHVSPVFKTKAVRDWSGQASTLWQMFSEDVDFTGRSIEALMKSAALFAKLCGVAFIVVDRATDGIEAETVGALASDRRALPYAFVVDPMRVQEVSTDKFGRVVKFVFVERDQDPNILTPAKRTMTPDGWELEDSKGKHTGTWNLSGQTPVIPLFSKDCGADNPLPPSEFLSIAQTNLGIYNMSSWLGEILVNQTFSILTYPSTDMDGLTIGTNNAIGYSPESSHKPEFIAPSAEPAQTLSENINRLQQECYRMASVVNVTGVRSEASGVAKAWDFEQTNQVLADFAEQVEQAEKRLARIFALFVGAELDYTVKYPSDYNISDVQTELANAEIAKGLAFGDAFNVEVFKRVLTAYLPELEDDDFDRLVAEYEDEAQRQKEEAQQNPLNLMMMQGEPKDDDDDDEPKQEGD